MNNKKSDLTVATEILRQLGGRKFLAMTGCKNLLGGDNHLQMHLAKNKSKAKYLTITLDVFDTYTMTFNYLSKGYKLIEVAEYTGVYFDQLQAIFTKVTGLYTSL